MLLEFCFSACIRGTRRHMALKVPLKMELKREISGLPPVPSINAGDVGKHQKIIAWTIEHFNGPTQFLESSINKECLVPASPSSFNFVFFIVPITYHPHPLLHSCVP